MNRPMELATQGRPSLGRSWQRHGRDRRRRRWLCLGLRRLGTAARAAATARVAPPAAVWTPTSDAPAGLLTPLEGERHDRFIEQAQAGDIDLVFFGTTSTEMWFWPDRGRSVWDRDVRIAARPRTSARRARASKACCGGCGTASSTAIRRSSWCCRTPATGDQAIPGNRLAEFVAGYAAIIAEIRARQPQAKILLFAAFPRGQLRREEWREIAEANAPRIAELADDETVFYVDIGDRFFRPDGSFNSEMWAIARKSRRGTQTPAFEVWAEELQPWLDRFVR